MPNEFETAKGREGERDKLKLGLQTRITGFPPAYARMWTPMPGYAHINIFFTAGTSRSIGRL